MTDNRAMLTTTPTAREIVMTRIFDAPRRQVFDAYTRPELVKRWLGAIKGWELVVCEIDLRLDGTCRYVWRHDDGSEMGMTHVVREFTTASRIVVDETFDDPWYEGDARVTVTFEEEGGRTTLTLTMRYGSNEVRDQVMSLDIARGMVASFDGLANVLETMEGGQRVHDAGMRP